MLKAAFNSLLAIFQNKFPAVPNPGVGIPAVTTKLEKTQELVRKGKKTVLPVSGRKAESRILLDYHNSGVMEGSAVIVVPYVTISLSDAFGGVQQHRWVGDLGRVANMAKI